MKAYLDLLRDVLANGAVCDDRTGTGTIAAFGRQIRFNLSLGFPLVTTKKLHLRSIVHELIWFISGDTNVRYLRDNGVTIWDEWADENGELGPVYGQQMRQWIDVSDQRKTVYIDQLAIAQDMLRTDPNSRRNVVSCWQPAELDDMALPPCHMIFQLRAINGRLSCHLNMRSADLFLGLPFNIASYALLTHMMAQAAGLKVGDLVVSIGDAHIYQNHIAQVREQLSRRPRSPPILHLNPRIGSIFDFRFDDVQFIGYDPHPAIKGEVAV